MSDYNNDDDDLFGTIVYNDDDWKTDSEETKQQQTSVNINDHQPVNNTKCWICTQCNTCNSFVIFYFLSYVTLFFFNHLFFSDIGLLRSASNNYNCVNYVTCNGQYFPNQEIITSKPPDSPQNTFTVWCCTHCQSTSLISNEKCITCGKSQPTDLFTFITKEQPSPTLPQHPLYIQSNWQPSDQQQPSKSNQHCNCQNPLNMETYPNRSMVSKAHANLIQAFGFPYCNTYFLHGPNSHNQHWNKLCIYYSFMNTVTFIIIHIFHKYVHTFHSDA